MDEAVLQLLKNHSQIKSRVMSIFFAPPCAHTRINQLLISILDLKNALVSKNSYNRISDTLFVALFSARKNSILRPKETPKSYLSTIEQSYSKHFQVVSEDQNFQTKLLAARSIYVAHFKNTGQDNKQ